MAQYIMNNMIYDTNTAERVLTWTDSWMTFILYLTPNKRWFLVVEKEKWTGQRAESVALTEQNVKDILISNQFIEEYKMLFGELTLA